MLLNKFLWNEWFLEVKFDSVVSLPGALVGLMKNTELGLWRFALWISTVLGFYEVKSVYILYDFFLSFWILKFLHIQASALIKDMMIFLVSISHGFPPV
jgi:hypothetical protein